MTNFQDAGGAQGQAAFKNAKSRLLAAFSLARMRFWGSTVLATGIFLTYLVPESLLFIPLFQIVNALMKTQLGNPNWLLKYWSRDRLMSVDARRAWLEPDLKPLPF